MLFRGQATEKKVKVLSGGERARLCLAGLLLGGFNVLVLDEPGNHLDVETVDALAAALCNYAGTVIFTSHDRTFVEAVASSVIEVSEGRVVHYPGSYRHYVDRLHAEVDAVDAAAAPASRPTDSDKNVPAKTIHSERKVRKQIASLEKTIGRLDEEKRLINERLLAVTDPEEAIEVHASLTRVAEELAQAEENWLVLQESLAGQE
jgi:ATP-binding cassette subfamily F protein 3